MANDAQAELWNEVLGSAWVEHAVHYDAMLEPLGAAVIDRLGLRTGERVLDLGCGTGATSLALAPLVSPGRVLGVDLSALMIAEARSRAEQAGADQVDFQAVDVQTGNLGRSEFDAAFSRLGVMFFDDPVAAFTNVADALRPGGRLCFICFQDPSANPGVLLPVMATADILSLPAPGDPTGPGPFSLADPDRTRSVLTDAGFVGVTIAEGPDHVEVAGVTDLRDTAQRMLEQNPMTGPRFTVADTSRRDAALDAAVRALEPHRDGDITRLDVSTWIVDAHTPT